MNKLHETDDKRLVRFHQFKDWIFYLNINEIDLATNKIKCLSSFIKNMAIASMGIFSTTAWVFKTNIAASMQSEMELGIWIIAHLHRPIDASAVSHRLLSLSFHRTYFPSCSIYLSVSVSPVIFYVHEHTSDASVSFQVITYAVVPSVCFFVIILNLKSLFTGHAQFSWCREKKKRIFAEWKRKYNKYKIA